MPGRAQLIPVAPHFDPEVVMLVSRGVRSSEKSNFSRWASTLNAMAEDVEERWDLLSEEQRRILVAMSAHHPPEPRASRILWAVVARLRGVFRIFFESAAAEREVKVAIQRFVEAVRDAEERSNPQHRAKTIAAVNDVLGGERPYQPMTPGAFREWLTKLPDRPK